MPVYVPEYNRVIPLAQYHQYECPLYQNRLRELLLRDITVLDKKTGQMKIMSRAKIREYLVNKQRDLYDVLYQRDTAYIDNIVEDECFTVGHRYSKGSHCQNIQLVELIDGIVKADHPEMIIFADQHLRASQTMH